MESRKGYDTYTRFTVHKASKEFPASLEDLKKEDPKKAYQQLGIYYAFNERHQALAENYLEQYLAGVENNLEKAEALVYLAYTKTIDPTFREEQLFDQVLALLGDQKQEEALITRAFAMQYKALMQHRKAIQTGSVYLDTAIILVKEAIASQRELCKTNSLIKIGLAEALHLQAIMLTRLGDVKKDSEYFVAADELFVEAAQLEKEFCEETNAPHFLTAITLQSHAMVLMKLKRNNAAMEKLSTAHADQLALFKIDVHPDIAKTLHFMGEVQAAAHNYTSAANAYLDALICKKQIVYKDNYMVNVTEKKLSETLTIMSKLDIKTEYLFALHKKIYKRLTGDMKEKFVNRDEEFVTTIKIEMERLRDIVSRQARRVYDVNPVRNDYTALDGMAPRRHSLN